MSTRTIDVHALALEKVGKILGPTRAHFLLGAFLAWREQARLASSADLLAFGQDLARSYGASEGCIGALLCRQARLLGATDAVG